MTARSSTSPSIRSRQLVVYLGVVASAIMILFPPFASLNGTEYAFLFTGPTWARGLEPVAAHLGISAQIQWPTLVVQLAALWAIAFGAIWFLRSTSSPGRGFNHAVAFGCFVLLLLPLSSARPADAMPADSTVGVQGGKYGLGFASSWPAYGISGTLQLSPMITAEAVVGAFGAISNFGGRVWYRFNRNHNYDLYGYGAASLYRYGYTTFDIQSSRTRKASESVVGVGGGVGLEYGLRSLFNDQTMPPIFFNAELGLALASFEFYNFSALVWGGGIHYRFGR